MNQVKMSWTIASACLLTVCVLVSPSLASVCPSSCVCSTTRDGLHRAACSDVNELYKFTLRQKHHNINILDLSHNNITKLTHELDRLTEVVTLDLSTNGIVEINKFLHNAKKLVHLNLANNRLKIISVAHLPTSVSSLDLTNNLLKDVPSDIGHLLALEHLELEGNPFHCTCENLIKRDYLLRSSIHIDAVKCASPMKLKGRSWLELKTKDICKIPKTEPNFLDMMMGDQPIDAVEIGKETTELKSMPLVAINDLEDGDVVHNKQQEQIEDDDSLQFLKVGRSASRLHSTFEGSGEAETATDIIESRNIEDSHSGLSVTEGNTEDPFESSGEGSGFGFILNENNDEHTETTTQQTELFTGPIVPLIPDDNLPEYPQPESPKVYAGGPNWHSEETIVSEKASIVESVTKPVARDTTVSEQIRVTQAAEVNEQSSSSKPATHKTGTYICIAIIVVLLVGLIGFAIIKGQIRKRRDRRLIRQQKRDVEKASKEMVDMNKSLLGKPVVLDTPIEKKANGKYELVPTHEPMQKKGENGDLTNGIKHSDSNGKQPSDSDGKRTNSPRDSNQNKNSSKDNNIANVTPVTLTQQETSFESDLTSPDSRKDTHSLSSEDIFVPLNDDDSPPRLNGNGDYNISQPLINGDQTNDSDFLSPSREYVPVYSPDMGRVRIKMSETPKPKTPVLVTRSRSNAGDIIITPSLDANRKSTT